ncbi:hypothetical protein [Bacillus cereus]|uniref:hypothetical protein n=1 Tax=Bacillus cereus TaxID=1396 RepID=UPI001879DBF1|nr:hypothetical protein [Bacillus cereus]MBE7099150.1 hypothetical protein [Bacillus cereus]
MHKMSIVGNDCSAVRFYRDSLGCEFRANGVIITGNEDMANLFDVIHTYKPLEGILSISNSTEMEFDNIVDTIDEIFDSLSIAGLEIAKLYTEWYEFIKERSIQDAKRSSNSSI